MAMSNDFSVAPSYVIYRDVPAGQLYDPTAPLAFWPAKDSDELFDALRAKFPHLKSHSDRMRDATIEFLLEERAAESHSANVSPAMPTLYDSMTETSPWQQSWPSASMTTLSSPEMTNFATPAFGDSPRPQVPQMTRQHSSVATPSDAQTPALDSMTSVFSLSTSEQPKQRVRRKMTDAEKVEYRKRRIVKACDKCSKRKRKCVHNQPEMEDLKKISNDNATHKVTKPRPSNMKQQHAEVSFTTDQYASDPNDVFSVDGLMGSYDDFTLLFPDPVLDFTFDDSLQFDIPTYNTQPDNFRQNVQNPSVNNARPHTSSQGTNHGWDWLNDVNANATANVNANANANINANANANANNNANANGQANANATANLTSQPQGFEPDQRVNKSPINNTSPLGNNHESHRRCDLNHTQSESLLTSGARLANAGQQDAHGIPVAVNATSNSGGLRLSTDPTHTPHVHGLSSTLQVDSDDRGRSPGEGGIGRPCVTQASLLPLTGNDQVPADTALRRPEKPAMSVRKSTAGTSPQDNNTRRHRTRSDGVYDPALQSELSLTSANSTSSNSGKEHAATLEGRPTILGGIPVSPRSTPDGRVGDRRNEGEWGILSSAQSPRSSPSHGERAPLSSQVLSRTSLAVSGHTEVPAIALQPQTRTQSALLASSSPFDRASRTQARSTELFRLKHRIPTTLETTNAATGLVPSVANLSAQANGGAYPRPSSNTNRSSSATTTAAAQQQVQAIVPSSSTTEKNAATESNGARMLFTESDTRRYRDHHGRSAVVDGFAPTASSNVARVCAKIALAILAISAVVMSTSSFALPSFMALAFVSGSSCSFVHSSWNPNLPSLRSSAQRLLTMKQEKHQPSLDRLSMLHRPVGCV